MRVQLPSLGDVVSAAYATLRRFPLVIATGAVAAIAAILSVEDIGPDALRERLLAAATLGIPLFTALTLVAERKQRPALAQALLGTGGLVALAFVYALWPGWSEQVRFFRYAQLSVAFHLMVAVLPLSDRSRRNAFWQYNRAMLERFVIAGVSSATLWAGLSLALAAVHMLFGVDVPDTGYFRLWAVMAFVFNTWYFLGGVPTDLAALESRRDYPKVLRVFAQYTLVPLVTVYLVILTLYLGKVLITRDWPSGWIGWLVSGVATTGIITLLLVHPVAEDEEQKWVAAFARGFWLALLPAIVMLWLALYQRVRQYGVTEPRYFLLVLSVWLAAIAVYYSVTRSKEIRVIPLTLGAVALLTFAGPWGAYDVSLGSQLGRLRALLTQSGRLVGGRIVRADTLLLPDSSRQVSAAVRYLVERHGTTAIARWFQDSASVRLGLDLRARPAGDYGGEDRTRRIVEAMGMEYVDRYAGREGTTYFTYNAVRRSVPVGGFDMLLAISTDSATAPGVVLAQALPAERSIRILRDGAVLILIPIDSALARAHRMRPRDRQSPVPLDTLRVTAENARARAVAYLTVITGSDSAGVRRVSALAGDVLVAFKP